MTRLTSATKKTTATTMTGTADSATKIMMMMRIRKKENVCRLTLLSCPCLCSPAFVLSHSVF